MKQSLAAVLTGLQGLGSDEWRERPVDRLAALGAMQINSTTQAARTSLLCSLGVDLIAFKLGGRVGSRGDAEDVLATVLAWPSWKLKLTASQRDRVARWAVTEWAHDKCQPRPFGCGGAKEVPSHDKPVDGRQPMQTCPTCRGTGRRHYSDSERTEALGRTYPEAMDVAHQVIGWAEALAIRYAARLLERD